MTDRYHSLTVVLADDIRSDDAAPLMAAIRLLAGVAAVEGNVADHVHYIAETRALFRLRGQLRDVLWPKAGA